MEQISLNTHNIFPSDSSKRLPEKSTYMRPKKRTGDNNIYRNNQKVHRTLAVKNETNDTLLDNLNTYMKFILPDGKNVTKWVYNKHKHYYITVIPKSYYHELRRLILYRWEQKLFDFNIDMGHNWIYVKATPSNDHT